MNIMFAGHLDRSFLLGSKPDRFRPPPSGNRSPHADAFEAYRSFYHRAGSIGVLSAALVQHLDQSPSGETIVSRRGPDGRIYDSIEQAELEDDALRLAKIVVLLKAFTDTSLAMMRLRAPDDPHDPDPVHHVEGILFAVLHAWQTQATLVMADCDRQILVELLDCIEQKGVALPFGIPDLRKVRVADAKVSGIIPNFEPGDHGDCNALREDPVVQGYRHRLRRLSESRTVNVGTLLKAALEEARRTSPTIREAPTDITLTSAWVRAIDTPDLDSVEIDPFRWTERLPTRPKMHIVVLSSSRSLG
ncbi:hypothetical protein [uncultured Methylobacterium sp.]|uniref:hypothetical protein n=1 Tax=uncultured Methylobacterium sp. TaxID=157278 RepID=UPI0025960BD2|nr:hypothetical protein [uncultured Methylobacterium sp.]